MSAPESTPAFISQNSPQPTNMATTNYESKRLSRSQSLDFWVHSLVPNHKAYIKRHFIFTHCEVIVLCILTKCCQGFIFNIFILVLMALVLIAWTLCLFWPWLCLMPLNCLPDLLINCINCKCILLLHLSDKCSIKGRYNWRVKLLSLQIKKRIDCARVTCKK